MSDRKCHKSSSSSAAEILYGLVCIRVIHKWRYPNFLILLISIPPILPQLCLDNHLKSPFFFPLLGNVIPGWPIQEKSGVSDEIQQGKYGIPIVKWDKCNRSEFPEKQLPDSPSKNEWKVTSKWQRLAYEILHDSAAFYDVFCKTLKD